MLFFHIITALTSVVFSTFLFLSPSQAKLQASYVLVGLTLASGTFLIIGQSGHILQTCLTGLVYIGAVSLAIVGARNKLAAQKE